MSDRPATPAKLADLLAYHLKAADAIKTVLDLLAARETVTKSPRSTASVLTRALALDAARRNGHEVAAETVAAAVVAARGRPSKSKAYHHAGAIKARRERTARRLAKLSLTDPKPFGIGAGMLLQRGYIAKKGDGYIRTAKAFTVGRP